MQLSHYFTIVLERSVFYIGKVCIKISFMVDFKVFNIIFFMAHRAMIAHGVESILCLCHIQYTCMSMRSHHTVTVTTLVLLSV